VTEAQGCKQCWVEWVFQETSMKNLHQMTDLTCWGLSLPVISLTQLSSSIVNVTSPLPKHQHHKTEPAIKFYLDKPVYIDQLLTTLFMQRNQLNKQITLYDNTRNVGTPKGRPTLWPPPPSRWCGKFYDVGNSVVVIVGSCKIFRGWVKTTVLFLAISGPKFM